MALDKQRILNELGNVVNQLQSADCGCMGKLFSNSNQRNPNAMANPPPNGCMRGGCCHGQGYGCHGYNAPGAGEPFAGRHCMGSCNPPKLYADTYNYLNHNLMQPVMKEVYDDLRTITPANTMMNSPIGAKMGLAQGNNPNVTGGNPGGNMGNLMAQNQMPGEAMGNQNAIPNMNHSPNVRFGNNNMDPNVNNPNAMQMGNQQQFAGQPMGQPGQQMGQPMGQSMGQPGQQMGQPMGQPMGGMGAHILNMMKGDASRHGNMTNEGGPPQGNLLGNAPQSPVSNVPGGQGQYAAGNMPGNNPGQYNDNMGQGNAVPMQNPTTQYMTQSNMYAGANAQNGQMNPMAANMNQMNPGSQDMRTVNATPAHQQMNAHNPYGQHSAGIAKFNEMFPGVMQGDLGFDPMAIAIQMNPANQQRAAMNTMQKMLMSNGEAINKNAMMQPVIKAANTVAANLSQSNQPASQVSGQSVVAPPMQQQQQLQGENAAAVPVQNNQVPQQQVYTALTGAPTMSQQQVPQQQYQGQYEQQQQQQQQQQQLQQQQQQLQQQQQQQMVNPNTGASSLPTVYEGSGDPNARQEGYPPTGSAAPTSAGQPMIMDPIFPADTSRNRAPMYMKPQRYYQYNTLGQPIEMIPTRSHPPDLSSQQTLGAQPAPTNYSNVKNTVSKTSLMGNKPVGKTPSRSQLQHIYNQYKGSQSYTQQNIKPSDNGASYSEGHLNVPQGNAPRQVPVEKVGGDTAANNAMNNAVVYKGDPAPPGQVGDVPAGNKPLGDTEKSPVNFSKVRNGLQDMTYTSYATSAAWSFHGATPAPFSTGYRFRHKV